MNAVNVNKIETYLQNIQKTLTEDKKRGRRSNLKNDVTYCFHCGAEGETRTPT